jgi:type IV pilus assembly protein PilW
MSIPRNHIGYRSAGFTLAELLVSLVLGLFLVGGTIMLFASNQTVYTDTTRTGELRENARFAQKYLLDDLRHAYFFGEKHYDTFAPDLDNQTPDNSIISGNCTGMAAAFSFNARSTPASAPVFGSTAVDGAAIGCISDAVRVNGIPSDVLVLKLVDRTPLQLTADLTVGQVYIASNRINGVMRLFTAGSTMPSLTHNCVGRSALCLPHGAYWEYIFRAYYVKDVSATDNIPPTLARKTLEWDATDGMSVVTEDLVEGVEGMRVLYATPSSEDTPEFHGASNITNWEDVTAVRVFLLVRTVDPDRAHADDASYVLGDTTVQATSGTALSQGAQLRNFHRQVVSSTVMLRNKPIVNPTDD